MFKVTPTFDGLNEKEIKKAKAACALWQDAWNDPRFEKMVKNFSWTSWRKTGRWPRRSWVSVEVPDFRWNQGLGRTQIFEKIKLGAETLNSKPDAEADVFIAVDREFVSGVIGYTYPDTAWQYVYDWFFSDASLIGCVGNFSHEYLHKLGFDHEFNYSQERDYTVPYAVGYITETIAESLLKENPGKYKV